MSAVKKEFGEILSKLRESRNESQQQLADAVGVTRQTLSRYENADRTINIEVMLEIAKHYNVSADYMLGLTENQTTDSNLQSVCEYTGLSETSVTKLHEMGSLLRNRIINGTFMEDLIDSEELRAIIKENPFLIEYIDSFTDCLGSEKNEKTELFAKYLNDCNKENPYKFKDLIEFFELLDIPTDNVEDVFTDFFNILFQLFKDFTQYSEEEKEASNQAFKDMKALNFMLSSDDLKEFLNNLHEYIYLDLSVNKDSEGEDDAKQSYKLKPSIVEKALLMEIEDFFRKLKQKV